MAYLMSRETADWVRNEKAKGTDIRSRPNYWKIPGGGDGTDGEDGVTLQVDPVDPDEGVYRLVARLSPILVYRNGAPIPMSNDMVPAGGSGPDHDPRWDGWWEVGSSWNDGAVWTEKVVVLRVGAVMPMDPEWAANQVPWASEWKLELMNRQDVAQGVRPGCNLIIGAVVRDGAGDGGRAVLYNDGPWMPDWITTDEEASNIVVQGGGDPTPVSITREDHTRGVAAAPYGMTGLYDFQDPEGVDTGSSQDGTWPSSMTNDHFIIRHWNEDAQRFEVAYIYAGSVCKGDGTGEPAGGGGYPDLPGMDADCQTVDTDLNHLYVWDSCRQQWVKITVGGQGGNGTDDRYWIKGSDEDANYGSAIGDSQTGKVIDLDAHVLNGSEWDAEEDFGVWNDLYVTRNTTVGGDLSVTGTSTLTGDVHTDGDLEVGDQSRSGAKILATGDILATSLTLGGQALSMQSVQVVTGVDFTNQTVTTKTLHYLGTPPT